VTQAASASAARKSPLGRQILLAAAGLLLAAATALPLNAGRAQTPGSDTVTPAPGTGTPSADTGSDLLQPKLQGNPRTLPRFRRPGDRTPARGNQPPPTGKFTAPSRIGAIPIYGSPPALGAGETGYDSTNNRRRRKQAQTPNTPSTPTTLGIPGAPPQRETTFTPVPTFARPTPPKKLGAKKPPAPEIHPLRAAARPGAVLPPPAEPLPVSHVPPEVHPRNAAMRPGAALPVPPPIQLQSPSSTPPPGEPPPNTLPLGTVPLRLLPIAAGDPYVPLGIRAGSFVVLPALELSAANTSNAQRTTGSSGATYFVAAPELVAHSDWARHALDINIHGTYTEYAQALTPSLNAPFLDSRVDGRIDVLRNTQVITENRFILATDNPGSPNLPAGLAKLPLNFDIGGTLGVVQTFNRLSVSLKGTFDRNIYNNSVLTDGEISSNGDRNFNQWAGILRINYELNPSLRPFIEVQEDERHHNEQFDRNGLERSSVGTTGKIGAAVDLFGSLTGEMAVGYLQRDYKDPTLPDVAGTIVNGSLTWLATALTTARFNATSQVYETVLPGTTATLTRDVNLQVDHAFLLWLVGTLKAGYGTDDYIGSTLSDRRYYLSGGFTYKMNPDLYFKGEVREDWQTATQPGLTYMATSFLFGIRGQR
jgi:hypothetical protein